MPAQAAELLTFDKAVADTQQKTAVFNSSLLGVLRDAQIEVEDWGKILDWVRDERIKTLKEMLEDIKDLVDKTKLRTRDEKRLKDTLAAQCEVTISLTGTLG